MERAGISEIGEAVLDENFPDVDLALRRGRHIDRDDGPWYAFILEAQTVLEEFYRRFGCELVHRTDGYFFLLPTGERLSRRQLSGPEMVVGQGLALLYLDPKTLESGGIVTRTALLGHLATVMGADNLTAAMGHKRRRNDERVAQQYVRRKVASALRRLALLGFVELLDEEQLRLRAPLMRFAEPVRGSGSPAHALEVLLAKGEVVLGDGGLGDDDDGEFEEDEDAPEDDGESSQVDEGEDETGGELGEDEGSEDDAGEGSGSADEASEDEGSEDEADEGSEGSEDEAGEGSGSAADGSEDEGGANSEPADEGSEVDAGDDLERGTSDGEDVGVTAASGYDGAPAKADSDERWWGERSEGLTDDAAGSDDDRWSDERSDGDAPSDERSETMTDEAAASHDDPEAGERESATDPDTRADAEDEDAPSGARSGAPDDEDPPSDDGATPWVEEPSWWDHQGDGDE